MNQVNLIGMVYGDPIIRQSQNGKKVVNFTLSVPRSYDKKHFDFVSCRAWERVADIVEKWCPKGTRIGVNGSLQTSTYDSNGKKVYQMSVVALGIDLIASSKATTKKKEEPSINTTPRQESPENAPQESERAYDPYADNYGNYGYTPY